jgi:cobalt-zinc-cadmium efflux system membrane fusion protein
MPSRMRNLLSLFRDQLPAVLTLALLGVVAWWGYLWDWNIPSLPELLHPSATKASAETEKKPEEAKEAGGANKPLPPIKLDSEDVLEAAGIKLERIEERLVGEYVKAHGDLDFDQNLYAHLSTRANGTAWSVHKNAGGEVKKDEVLALIASPQLAQLKFDLQQTLLNVHTRQLYSKRLQGSGDATALQDRDRAEAALREARISLSKDQQSLQNLGLTISTEELARMSDEQVAARLRTLGIPDTLLQRLESNTLTNNLLPMYAPFDGVVIKRDIVIGEVVNPGTPQFVLADLRRLWIMLHVRLEDAGKLRLGQEVAFHLDGPNEDAPPAKITWISAEVDKETRTVAVRADVPNPKGRLRPNTFGDARILVRQEKRLTVPNEALQFDGKSHVVFARGASATVFQPLRVELGPRHEDFTVILHGVEAGQILATSGSHALLSEMLKERIGGED